MQINLTEIAKYIKTARIIEREIISPNIDKILCSEGQQVILMNTIFGKFKSSTMYVAGISGNFSLNSTEDKSIDLNKSVAHDILNPISCDLMFGATFDKFKSTKLI